MKTQVKTQILVWLLVFVISFFGCKKEDPIVPTPKPPVEQAAPTLQILVSLPKAAETNPTLINASKPGEKVALTFESNEKDAEITSKDPSFIRENGTTFTSEPLVTGVYYFQAKSKVTGKTTDLKVTITVPTVDEVKMIGTFILLKTLGGSTNHPNVPSIVMYEHDSTKTVTQYIFGADKTYTVYYSPTNYLKAEWSIKTVNPNKILVRGGGDAFLEELTPTSFTVRQDVNQAQIEAGLKGSRSIYLRIK